MENIEEKRKALEKALQGVDSLIDMFESSVKKEPVKKGVKRDFSKVCAEVFPDSVKAEETDERLNMSMTSLLKEASKCSRCSLCKTRHNVVFGEGCSIRPEVMVIGEGPGETEDMTGRPFVGKAGQYLDKWLAAISLSRETNCYIANVVKCRPPENRDPLDDEKTACFPFMKQQIELINPRAILCVGKPASSLITGQKDSTMASMRGRLFMYNSSIPVFCTYHPSAVLRDMTLKVSVWEDLKKMASFLKLEINGVKK